MIRQILNIAWKELLQVRRDTFLVLFLIIAPTMQLALISMNTSRGLSDVPVAVLNLDQSGLSREFVAELDATQELNVLYFPATHQQLQQLVDDGAARVAIVIPQGFSRSFHSVHDLPAQVQALIDGTNVLVGSMTEPVIASVMGLFARKHIAEPQGVDLGGVQVYTQALFNPTLDIQWFLIPSLVAFIVYQVALVLAATGFVREKEIGTMEQLLITPIRRLELIIGKSLTPVIISTLNFILLMAVQTKIYHIPMRGDPGLLLLTTVLAVIAIVGVGTLISLLTQNQQQAVLLVFLLAILEVTLSGYMLPVENMPRLMRWLAQISTLQHFMTATRSITISGATLTMVLPHLLALLGLALVTGLLSWRAFSSSMFD